MPWYTTVYFITWYDFVSGEVEEDDDGSLSEDKDWEHYWRILFKKISVDDIKQFENTYKGII